MEFRYYRYEAMETIARRVIKTHNPALLAAPSPIPIEDIMERDYGLIVIYQQIRNDGRVLGETAFDDMVMPVYDKDNGGYMCLPVERGTIIIDSSLLRPRSVGRMRFTLAHELAHWILHQYVYEGTQEAAAKLKKADSSSSQANPAIERQADRLASLLLMPSGQVKIAFHRNHRAHDITAALAELFCVSKQAMDIRLKELRLV